MAEARYTTPNQQLGSKVALAHTVYGSPASAFKTNIAGGSAVAVAAGQAMVRAYKEPARRKKDNPALALCGEEGCRAFKAKDPTLEGYCPGHARKHGLLPTCSEEGCSRAAKKERMFCVNHEPVVVTEAELFDDDPE